MCYSLATESSKWPVWDKAPPKLENEIKFSNCKVTQKLPNETFSLLLFNNNYARTRIGVCDRAGIYGKSRLRADVFGYGISPFSRAASISSFISGSRSFSTRLSSTASFITFFSSPTTGDCFKWNSSIISLPSMTGCSNRL